MIIETFACLRTKSGRFVVIASYLHGCFDILKLAADVYIFQKLLRDREDCLASFMIIKKNSVILTAVFEIAVLQISMAFFPTIWLSQIFDLLRQYRCCFVANQKSDFNQIVFQMVYTLIYINAY